MGKEREFENILDECIERVMRGEDIKSCLTRYPEHAAGLEPLLKTVFGARQAVDIKPRPEFRQRAANEFQEAIRSMPVKETRGFFKWQLSWVAPVAAVLVILAAGTGTVIAANNSLPGEPLYKVKLATEAVQLAFTPSDLGKAELYARFADNRVDEIVALANNGDAKQIDTATDHMNTHLIAMANLTGGNNAAGGGETESAMFQMSAEAAYESADMQAKQALTAPAPMPEPAANPTATEPVDGTPPVTVAVPPPPEPTDVTTEPGTAPPPTEDTNATQPPMLQMPLTAQKGPMMSEPEATALEESASGGIRGAFESDGNFDKQAKLKRILSDKIREHLEKLQEELEKAPDELKPALQRAIEVIINGYETNLSNLR